MLRTLDTIFPKVGLYCFTGLVTLCLIWSPNFSQRHLSEKEDIVETELALVVRQAFAKEQKRISHNIGAYLPTKEVPTIIRATEIVRPASSKAYLMYQCLLFYD